MVLEAETSYDPRELLGKLKAIESRMGRIAGEKWGPRPIDIDILFYGQRMVNDTDLTIPHPQFYNRPFAIILLGEVAPDYTPPFASKKIKDLLSGASREGIEVYCD
jgi:2-amino-4-hydroxy-6-hydroxymethyldihydropteridine diphosphokinase